MKKLSKILLEALESFFIGAAIMFLIIVLYSIRYAIKYGQGFALALNGIGTEAGTWHVLSVDEILFVCGMGGLILLLIDLVYNIIKLLHEQNQ